MSPREAWSWAQDHGPGPETAAPAGEVEISPGYRRPALRVNSTALRFRSPQSALELNSSVRVTIGGAPPMETGLTLRRPALPSPRPGRRLVDFPKVTSVTPPALSVGEPGGRPRGLEPCEM